MKTHATVSPSPLTETGSALIQVSGALILVILIIFVVAWLAKRSGLINKQIHNNGLKITSSLAVGTRERLVIVEVENVRLLLGITSQQITCLSRLPSGQLQPTAAQNTPEKPASDFACLLNRLRKRQGSR